MNKDSETRNPRAVPYSGNREFLDQYAGVLEMLCQVRLSGRTAPPDEGPRLFPVRAGRRGRASSARPADPSVLDKYGRLREKLRNRVKATIKRGEVKLPLVRLVRQFGLTELEEDILLCAMIYHSRRSFEKLMDEATGMGSFSIRSILALFFDNDDDRIAHRGCFMPNSTLVRNGLLRIGGRRNWNALSEEEFLCLSPEIPLRISSLILDQEMAEGDGKGPVTLIEPRIRLEDLGLPDGTIAEIRRVAQLEKARQHERLCQESEDEDEHRIILLYGAPGTGKHLAAQAIAGLLGRKLLRIKTGHYLRREFEEAEDLVQTLGLAKLMDAVPCFSLAEGLLDGDPDNFLTGLFADEFASFNDTVILTANGNPDLSGNVGRHVTYMIDLPLPSLERRMEMLAALIPAGMQPAPDLDLEKVAERLKASGSKLKGIVKSACLRASTRKDGERELRMADFFPTTAGLDIASIPREEASYIAEPCAKLDDVILTDALRKQVRQIVGAVRARDTVFEKWGLGAVYGTGQGISALFSGPSGTGKTLTAEAIASELGRPMRVVQLSGMMDKYVGETEKNTAGVFRLASAAGEVLVIDEADALFATRASYSEHNSYYINSHINTLLKEMDDFKGVVILTTNRAPSMDQAFERRIRWKLEFPQPDQETRAALWRLLLPPSVPVAGDVDFQALAGEFDFTGGLIRSSILKAAFAAAEEGDVVCMRHLKDAAATEKIAGKPGRKQGIGFERTA